MCMPWLLLDAFLPLRAVPRVCRFPTEEREREMPRRRVAGPRGVRQRGGKLVKACAHLGGERALLGGGVGGTELGSALPAGTPAEEGGRGGRRDGAKAGIDRLPVPERGGKGGRKGRGKEGEEGRLPEAHGGGAAEARNDHRLGARGSGEASVCAGVAVSILTGTCHWSNSASGNTGHKFVPSITPHFPGIEGGRDLIQQQKWSSHARHWQSQAPLGLLECAAAFSPSLPSARPSAISRASSVCARPSGNVLGLRMQLNPADLGDMPLPEGQKPFAAKERTIEEW